MNRDELMKMLDLGGVDAERAEGVVSVTPGRPPPGVRFGPTALELDDWSLRKGRELLAESDRLRSMGTNEHAVADFHAAAFLPDPVLMPGCDDSLRHAFLSSLLETPEYHALHASTALCEASSAVAAACFAEQFSRLPKEAGVSAGDGDISSEMATLRAAGRAVTDASEGVAAMAEASAALGMGPGSPGANDPTAIAAAFRRVRSNPVLRRICETAGRMRRVAQSKQRQKSSHGLDDVVGVTRGGEVWKLLPHELVRLADPETELDALRRLAERQSLCRDYEGGEPAAKGPVVVVVDESGSMLGEKVESAKALALTLAWVARRQRRWCALVAYSGDSGERLLPLPPGRWDENLVMDWLCAFIGRGSTLDVPVREMPDIYRRLGAPAGKTDLVFVTDARASIPRESQNRFRDWKTSAKARLVSLVLADAAGDLALVSDEVYLVRSLDADEAAVGRLLSL